MSTVADELPDESKSDGKRKSKKKANPYLDARREWNAQFGRQVSEKNSWRMVALFSLLITLLSIAGLLTLGASTKVVPYVAVIDELGNPIAQGSAKATGVADPRVMRAIIGDFFTNFRSVTTDGYAQKERIRKVYALLSIADPSYRVMNEHFQKEEWDPFLRAKDMTVNIEVSSILELSKNSFQVEWVEMERDRSGEVLNRDEYQAALTLKQSEELSGNELLENLLGLYVTHISWTKRI